MSRTKKKAIIETHGQVETEPQTQPTMLEQSWGYNDMSRYGTKDESVYASEIDSMTRSDLENHARKCGVVVVEDSQRLKAKLINEFRTYVSLLLRPVPAKIEHGDTSAKVVAKALADALKTLAEGR